MEVSGTSQEWMSSAEASRSRARTSATPGREPGSKGPGRVFGGSSQGSFANYSPGTWWSRTSQLSLLAESIVFSGIWPRAGMTRSGVASGLPTWARPTGGTECGSWPTPDASAVNVSEPLEKWEARREREKLKGRNGNGFGTPLGVAVRQWPTPTASDGTGGRVSRELGGTRPSGAKRAVTLGTAVAHSLPLNAAVKTWPTPRTSDTNGPGRHGTGGPDLRTAVAEQTPAAGSLNPEWVCWLMGFPEGWLDIGPENPPTHPGSP